MWAGRLGPGVRRPVQEVLDPQPISPSILKPPPPSPRLVAGLLLLSAAAIDKYDPNLKKTTKDKKRDSRKWINLGRVVVDQLLQTNKKLILDPPMYHATSSWVMQTSRNLRSGFITVPLTERPSGSCFARPCPGAGPCSATIGRGARRWETGRFRQGGEDPRGS